MRFYFIVEDSYGVAFIKKIFQKKHNAGLFSGTLVDARRSPLGPKITRIIRAVRSKPKTVDRVIILADADGESIDEKAKILYGYVDKQYRSQVSVVLLDYEIEDWICYSLRIRVSQKKPSDILKEKFRYEKRQLPKYVPKLDCNILRTCSSFQRLLTALTPNT